MDERKKQQVLSQLKIRIGDYDAFVFDYFQKNKAEFEADTFINMAIDDCTAYFGTLQVPNAVTVSTLAELAYAHWQRMNSNIPYGVKSTSYTEGSVSKSEAYSTPQEINAVIEDILKPYSRFRVVRADAVKNTG